MIAFSSQIHAVLFGQQVFPMGNTFIQEVFPID
jgi:hypothetical protein